MKSPFVSCRLLLVLGCLVIGTSALSKEDLINILHGKILFPGTKYCGRFNSSTGPDDLGVMKNTDRCCMHHDGCPASVGPLSWNYFKFNAHLVSLTHCACDDALFNCLKKVQIDHPEEKDTAEAIGQWFFEGRFKGFKIAPTMSCFVFTKQCVCLEQPSWDIKDKFCTKWGKIEGVGKLIDYLGNQWQNYPNTVHIPKRPKWRGLDEIVDIARKYDLGNLKLLKPTDYEECSPNDKRYYWPRGAPKHVETAEYENA